MKYIKDNKELLIKYVYILISNILIYILCSFYFKNKDYLYAIIMVINIVMDLIIYNYKGTKKFVNYLDFIFNLILSMILIIPIKNTLEYSTILFTLVFTNNIIFIRSRLSNKFFIKSIQYLMMLLYSILTMFVSIFIYLLIK